MKESETAEEILLTKNRCTIRENDADINENYHFVWKDVIEAMQEYAESYHASRMKEGAKGWDEIKELYKETVDFKRMSLNAATGFFLFWEWLASHYPPPITDGWNEDDVQVLLRAINKWGTGRQILKIQEECLELALAINHSSSGFKEGDMSEKMIDEIADVTILMKQAEIIFDKSKIQERIKFKINRLNEILNELESAPKQTNL